MRSMLFAAVFAATTPLLIGCGSEEYKYENENPESPDTVLANDVYDQLTEMKRAVREEGPRAVDTLGFLEGMQGYAEDEEAKGSNAALYDEITAGVKDLQSKIKSGASKAEVGQMIDDLMAKADKLPHTKGQQAQK